MKQSDSTTPSSGAFVSSDLLSEAQANPNEDFQVIVQGDGSSDAGHLAQLVGLWAAHADGQLVQNANQAATNLNNAQSESDQASSKWTHAQAQASAATIHAALAPTKQNKLDASNAKLDASHAQSAWQQAQNQVTEANNQVSNANQAFTNEGNQIVNQDVIDEFSSITGVAVTLTGAQITKIVNIGSGLLAITPNSPVTVSGTVTPAPAPTATALAPWPTAPAPTTTTAPAPTAPAPATAPAATAPATPTAPAPTTALAPTAPLTTAASATAPAAAPAPLAPVPGPAGRNSKPYSNQIWPYESKSADNWKLDADPTFDANMPSIAVVDSGIQPGPDFGNRIVGEVNLSTLAGNQDANDDRGHGTFVAGVAADSLPGITGGDPAANLVDVKVLDASGEGLTSNIISACQWILNNASKYNIRVVNMSLQSSITAPFFLDPLDRAVEQLWFHGITVVVASGNYGVSSTQPSGVLFSPGDDPFVITVGAADTMGSTNPRKATMAPWSAWGYTIDGFAKPELSAPGRYMIGPVPTAASLTTERPTSVVSPGYMQLSGTSFATPVVSAAAANILAAHPNWAPDQVKGALMLTAQGLSGTLAGGVGVVQASDAVWVNNPPNPNAALEHFVTNTSGSPSFNSSAWISTVESNASWNSVSWNDASWDSASWDSVSWNDASWDSVSWNDASWDSVSWNDASWDSASAEDVSQEDAAEGDNTSDPSADTLGTTDLASLLADPNFDPSSLPPALQASLAPDPAATTPATTTTPTPAATDPATPTTPDPTTITPDLTTTTDSTTTTSSPPVAASTGSSP